MTIKEKYQNSTSTGIKVHLDSEGPGLVGRFSAQELVEKWGDCEFDEEEYEKDFGEDEGGCPILATMSFIQIHDQIK